MNEEWWCRVCSVLVVVITPRVAAGTKAAAGQTTPPASRLPQLSTHAKTNLARPVRLVTAKLHIKMRYGASERLKRSMNGHGWYCKGPGSS